MSTKSAILVILQIATMIYLLFFNNPFSDAFGLVLQIISLGLGFWGILTMSIGNFNIQPEVKSNSLVKSGPYKWIRNPMYTAVILFYLPIVVHNSNWMNVFVFLVLIVTLIVKIFSEELFLEERFGEHYIDYKKETKRLIPFFF